MGKNVGTIVAPNVFFITAWQTIVFSLLIYFKKILCRYTNLKISDITINDIDAPQQIWKFPLLITQSNCFGWQLMKRPVSNEAAC